MLPIYLNFVSLTILISVFFTAVLGLYLITRPKKSASTFHLSLSFLYFFGLNIGYVVGFSVYSVYAAYHDRFVLFLALLSISHMIQFLLHFTGMSERRFPRRLLIFHYLFSCIVALVWLLKTYQRRIIFHIDGQFWNFTEGELEKIISAIVLLHILSIFGFGIWRYLVSQAEIKKHLLFFLVGFAFVAIAPGIANMLNMFGTVTKETFQLVYCVITLNGWFAIFIFYLNSTNDRISFLAKILGISFATFMILLLIVNYALMEISDRSYFRIKKSEARSAIETGVFSPPDLVYIHSYDIGNKLLEYLFKNEAVHLDFESNQDFYSRYLAANDLSQQEDYFLRQNRSKDQTYYAVLILDHNSNKLYEVGYDYLDYRAYLHKNGLYVIYLLSITTVVLIIGLPLFMHGSLTGPINTLITGLQKATKGNYINISTRHSEDEIGYLVRSFNELVTTTAQSKQKLLEYTQNLEEMVKERTNELEEAQQELLTSARRAGMADIASNVLHNVGNVLNSVVVNTNVLKNAILDLNVEGMANANKLYDENKENQEFFIDPEGKGQKMVKFYSMICKSTMDLQKEMLKIIRQLEDKTSVISDVISAQQTYASGPYFKEKIDLCATVERMLTVQYESISINNIRIDNQCKQVPQITGQKIKLLHVLINLYRNAKEAVMVNDFDNRTITLKTEQKEGHVLFSISDNGIGFDSELKTKIFQHGFSTKTKGRGFGLHSCANDIQEMNGSISAVSEGLYKGATFTLMFPLANES